MKTITSRSAMTYLLIGVVWARTVLPNVISSFTITKIAGSANSTSAATSALADQADHVLRLLILAVTGVVMVFFGRTAVLRRPLALAVLLAPWLYIVFRNQYNGHALGLTNELVYPAIVLAIWLLQPRLRDLQFLGYLTGALAVGSIAMGVFTPARGLLQSPDLSLGTLDKQILGPGVLIGPFVGENVLGQILAIGAATLLLIANRKLRWVLFAAVVYAVLWTSARGALVSIAVLIVIALLMRAAIKGFRQALSIVAGLAVLTLVVATPLLTTNPTAFTNRGSIWQASLKAWSGQQLFGLDTGWYLRQLASSENIANTASQGHNEFVHLLTTGGIVLVVLTGILCATLLFSAARTAQQGEFGPIQFLVAYFAAFWLEQSLGFVDQQYLFPMTVVPISLILLAVPEISATLELRADLPADSIAQAASKKSTSTAR